MPKKRGSAWIAVARFIALAAALLGSLLIIGVLLQFPAEKADLFAYRDAANRLLDGQALYPPTDPDAGNVYRYSPWFAFAWMPFALLGDVGVLLWRALVFASALYVLASVAAPRTHASLVLAALAAPMLAAPVLGNVEVPLVALLIWRRAGPVAVGIAASLKLFPLLLCAGYVAERRWRDAGIAVAVAVVLWLPAPLFGLGGYVTDPGIANGTTGGLLWDAGVWLPALVLMIGAVTLLALRRSPWTWVAASLAMPWSIPRYTGNQLAYLWPALGRARW